MIDSSEGEEEEQNTIGEYDGARNDVKQRHGYGIAHLPNGDIYRGYYSQGKRHGAGHYRFKKNASRYTGEWQEGKRHGRGVFVYPDGTRYEGYWADDMKSGQGTYYFANGNKYVGDWHEDMRQGMGICFYPASNCKYVGEWENDRRHGKGALVHQHHRFEGLWKEDLPSGPGCYIFGDELVQEGTYVLRQEELEDDDLGHSGDEDQPQVKLIPVWRAERLLAGEAALNRIQHSIIDLERIPSHVSIGSAMLPPDKPPPPPPPPPPEPAATAEGGDAPDASESPTAGAAADGAAADGAAADGAAAAEGAEGAAAEPGAEGGEVDPEADQVGGDEAALAGAGAGETPRDYTMELKDGDSTEPAEGSEAEGGDDEAAAEQEQADSEQPDDAEEEDEG